MCAIVDHVGFTCPCGRGGQLLRAIEGYASYFGRGSYPKFSFVIRKGGVVWGRIVKYTLTKKSPVFGVSKSSDFGIPSKYPREKKEFLRIFRFPKAQETECSGNCLLTFQVRSKIIPKSTRDQKLISFEGKNLGKRQKSTNIRIFWHLIEKPKSYSVELQRKRGSETRLQEIIDVPLKSESCCYLRK